MVFKKTYRLTYCYPTIFSTSLDSCPASGNLLPHGSLRTRTRSKLIYQTIQNFPDQLQIGWDLAQQAPLEELAKTPVRQIGYAAMGGSSLPADLINDYLRTSLQLELIRDYQLPERFNQDDLVICASFSGNTEETITVFNAALQRGIRIIALSNGGKLQELARQNNVPFILIPDCIQPRCATGYFFTSILGILQKLSHITPQQNIITEVRDHLNNNRKDIENLGKEIASTMHERVPIIYGPTELQAVCRIWKIKINENAKTQAFFNNFPELNHNEMVGYTLLKMSPIIIYLNSPSTPSRIRERMKIMQKLLEDKIPFQEVTLKAKTYLAEIFEALLIGDYASYYLAKNYGVDPTPVAMVEEFKKMLS